MEQDNIFAKRLKEARLSAGLKQSDLAEKAGITAASISAYESTDLTKGKNPSLENAKAIAKALNVSLDWLCGLIDSKSGACSGTEEDNRLSSAIKFVASLIECGAFKENEVSTIITVLGEHGYPEDVKVKRAQLTATNSRLSEAIKNISALFKVYHDGLLPEEAYQMSKSAVIDNISNYVICTKHWNSDPCFPLDYVDKPGIYNDRGKLVTNDNDLSDDLLPF